MNQNRSEKFNLQDFSIPDLLSSHLSRLSEIAEQANNVLNPSVDEISKILSQSDNMTTFTKISQLNQSLLESANKAEDFIANLESRAAMVQNQSIAERFTGIERMNQALLESQNILRDGFANSGLNKVLLESISSESVVTESKFKELKQLIGYKNVTNALSELKKTLEVESTLCYLIDISKLNSD